MVSIFPRQIMLPCVYCGRLEVRYQPNYRESRKKAYCNDECKRLRCVAVREGRMEPLNEPDSEMKNGGGSEVEPSIELPKTKRRKLSSIPSPGSLEKGLLRNKNI